MSASPLPAIRRAMLAGLLLHAGFALSGCASTPRADDGSPRAVCLVCKCNADLGCMDVKITEATPRCEYQGKTYYFCSDDCRKDFLRKPEKYLK